MIDYVIRYALQQSWDLVIPYFTNLYPGSKLKIGRNMQLNPNSALQVD